ncbi:MAG: bifunctional nuclease family protein [Clostridium sp.]|nr:bifunctional nuclease family protein [Prevotella sp.]MCM1429255.1 bifunctional nuclease family protein [Clostridium sp.]MCM1475712.1 bifunctional nuclease family protein [Muribaculaceae bacterium]
MNQNNDQYNTDYDHELRLIGITYNQIESGVYAMILEEVGGNRRIPIVIGYAEAQAIECKLQNVATPRPLTHDLMANMIHLFNSTLTRIAIRRLPNGVFAATLYIKDSIGKLIILDARSSDAIALAIRMGAPIFTSAEVLNEAGFSPDEARRSSSSERRREVSENISVAGSPIMARKVDYNSMTVSELSNILDKAVADEDYELAGRIKKIIESRGDEPTELPF